MKLRIKGNSIRFRLTKSMVDELAAFGSVSSGCEIIPGSKRFEFGLKATDTSCIRVEFENQTLVCFVPAKAVALWASSEQVALEAELDTMQKHLNVLIEKDFTCLVSRPDEDESDHFPNPLAKEPND